MKTSKKYVRVFAGAVCAAVMMTGAAVNAESFATVKGGGLNLRETASLDARVLGQYPTGTWITILEEGETWHKVSVDGKTGYMMNKYLNAATASATMYVRTNTGIGLNLRTKPGMDGAIITSFKPGTAVTVMPRS